MNIYTRKVKLKFINLILLTIFLFSSLMPFDLGYCLAPPSPIEYWPERLLQLLGQKINDKTESVANYSRQLRKELADILESKEKLFDLGLDVEDSCRACLRTMLDQTEFKFFNTVEYLFHPNSPSLSFKVSPGSRYFICFSRLITEYAEARSNLNNHLYSPAHLLERKDIHAICITEMLRMFYDIHDPNQQRIINRDTDNKLANILLEDRFVEELLVRDRFYKLKKGKYANVGEQVRNILSIAIKDIFAFSLKNYGFVDDDLTKRLYDNFRSRWEKELLHRNSNESKRFQRTLKRVLKNTIFPMHKAYQLADSLLVYNVDLHEGKERFLVLTKKQQRRDYSIIWTDVHEGLKHLIKKDDYKNFTWLIENIELAKDREIFSVLWDIALNNRSRELKETYRKWLYLVYRFYTNKHYFGYLRRLFKRFKLNRYDENLVTGKTKRFSELRWAINGLYNSFEYFRLYRGEKGEMLINMEMVLDEMFNRFRPVYGGKPVNEGALIDILARSKSRKKRQEAWIKMVSRGAYMAKGRIRTMKLGGKKRRRKVSLMELFKLRNKLAKRLRVYSNRRVNFFEFSDRYGEFDIDDFFKGDDSYAEILIRNMAEPWQEIVNDLRKEIGDGDIYPWDYQYYDPDGIIQAVRPYMNTDTNTRFLNELLKNMGFGNLSDMPIAYDSFARKDKESWACCFVRAICRDTRVLLTETANSGFADFSDRLHETGHAVMGSNPNSTIHNMLQSTFVQTDEGFAEFLRYMAFDEKMIVKYFKMPDELRTKFMKYIRRFYFVQFMSRLHLAMFENEIYKNPKQDCNKLWWDLYEKVYGLKRPPKSEELAVWGYYPHLISGAYAQDYTYARMFACQLIAHMNKIFPDGIDNPASADWIRKHIFLNSNLWNVNTITKRATGRSLNPRYLLEFLVGKEVTLETEPPFSSIDSLVRNTAAILDLPLRRTRKLKTGWLLKAIDNKIITSDKPFIKHTSDNQVYFHKLIKTCNSQDRELRKAAKIVFLKLYNNATRHMRSYIYTNFIDSAEIKKRKYRKVRRWLRDRIPELGVRGGARYRPFKKHDNMIAFTLYCMKNGKQYHNITEFHELLRIVRAHKAVSPYLFTYTGQSKVFFHRLISTCASGDTALRDDARELLKALFLHVSPDLGRWIVTDGISRLKLKEERYRELQKWLRENIYDKYIFSANPKNKRQREIRNWLREITFEKGLLGRRRFKPFRNIQSLVNFTLYHMEGGRELDNVDSFQKLLEAIKKNDPSVSYLFTWTGNDEAYFNRLIKTCASPEPALRNAARKLLMELIDHISPQLRIWIIKDSVSGKAAKTRDLHRWLQDNFGGKLHDLSLSTTDPFTDLSLLYRITAKVIRTSLKYVPKDKRLSHLLNKIDKARDRRRNPLPILAHTLYNEFYIEKLIQTCVSENQELRESAQRLLLKLMDHLYPKLREYVVFNYFFSIKRPRRKKVCDWIKDNMPMLEMKQTNRAFRDTEHLMACTKFYMVRYNEKYDEVSNSAGILGLLKSQNGDSHYLFRNSSESRAYFDKLVRTLSSNNERLRFFSRRLLIALWHKISPNLKRYLLSRYEGNRIFNGTINTIEEPAKEEISVSV